MKIITHSQNYYSACRSTRRCFHCLSWGEPAYSHTLEKIYNWICHRYGFTWYIVRSVQKGGWGKRVVDKAARSWQDAQSSLVPFTGLTFGWEWGLWGLVEVRIVITCSCSPPALLVGRGPPLLCLSAGHSTPGQKYLILISSSNKNRWTNSIMHYLSFSVAIVLYSRFPKWSTNSPGQEGHPPRDRQGQWSSGLTP